jgi:hypothetical protein
MYPMDTKYAGPANANHRFHVPEAEVDTLELISASDRRSV